LVCDYRYKIS